MEKNRNPWLDNVKGLLIFLVVFGHLIEIYRHSETHTSVLYIYNVIYTFHMPLFILISGYFFRPNKFEKIIQLTFIYFLWQVINGFFSKFIKHHELVTIAPDSRILDIFVPYWTMWFLFGIIVWNIITPIILKLRYPLLYAVGLAVWISYIDNVPSWFSIRKLINFYPYFLIGYFLKQKNILSLLAQKAASWRSPVRLGALFIVLTFLLVMVLYTSKGIDTDLLFMRNEYAHYGWSVYKGATFQVMQYATITVLCIALILLITQKRILFTFNKFGIYTLSIYLMHSSTVRVFRQFVPEQISNDPILLLIISFVLSYLFCLIVTSKFVIRLISPLVHPNLNWALKLDKNTPD
ncbi:acyltransferase family protein [Bacillus sp. 31A1R]|uniref:Acyltransferase family protein n=1 Tax=Robertmurraya mangrovi TaxID=3098077 RepID=A0ABU5IXQ1_9BACI|nr:acyltransferase family protein [Bacillus sp. 31A1R]MDZ5471880.1 acyltransferase family protein [Bacillus sp. 31A1R]